MRLRRSRGSFKMVGFDAAPLSAALPIWSKVQAAVYDWDAPQSFREPVDVPRQHRQGKIGTGD